MADTPAGKQRPKDTAPLKRPRLIIFDCDGVLVDSEPLSFRVLRDNVAAAGASIPMQDCYKLFLGKSLATTTEILSRDFGVDFSSADLESMRLQLFDLYRKELRPIPGIAELLRTLDLPVCVASSSQLERIRLSLEITGLLSAFDPHIYSASMVTNGKPAPDLFLHAARVMRTAPEDCLVIEDSPAGIEAAKRAGMSVVGFTGGGHAQTDSHRAGLEALEPAAVFGEIATLQRYI
ncbi:HAD family phosphatase [Pelagibius sp. Alg239-R121]|uniref:HAD family hydrolase n=1 Tax=Pelagibius sp. Alg239-R121 TaxID=2993448 RepID=UPI0024A74D6D|nr:HAD family hydrolase [Pelagibius sp. Alg239-R121]